MIHSRELARNLLQIKAIKINVQNLFTWASGIQSPIYCDNRLALSFPDIRNSVKLALVELTKGYNSFDYVAGVATAGIPWGVLVAEELGKPFVYIRSSAKSHGRRNRIEGLLEKGKSVIVIEDLISTGGSSIDAVEAIREIGNEVVSVIAIFSYNLEKARGNFEKAGCEFKTISDYDTLIDEARKENYITNEEFELIKNWKLDPENWNKK